jgi:serine/threonine protein kinase
VYKAHDPLLNRFVAIKTISPRLAADAEFRRRFHREAQSAAQLNHPNVITVFDFGEDHGLTYMAMELLEGRDLKDLIRTGSLVRLSDALDLMEQVCDGLAFAHARGVVHRDLKPGNIHVQPSGQAKILDFGLARLGESEMTRTGTVMGTPNYMSPEQVRGDKADARSDVFSLGAVFYEALSRHRPFDAGSVHGILLQVTERDPEPLKKWVPDLPGELGGFIERALAKDPARRFQHAGEMREALREIHRRLATRLAAEPPAGPLVPPDATLHERSGPTILAPPKPPDWNRELVTGRCSDAARCSSLGRDAAGRSPWPGPPPRCWPRVPAPGSGCALRPRRR